MNAVIEDTIEDESQPMEDIPESSSSSSSSTSSDESMSDSSSKGDDVVSLEKTSPLPYIIQQHPGMEMVNTFHARTKSNHKLLPQRVFSEEINGNRISAILETADLWKQFNDIGTEMIVTRRGRRMFPPLKIQLLDLDPKASYVLLMDIAPCDEYRYKFHNYSWQQCFKEDCSATRYYVHPDSPALGAHWLKSIISFYKLKLTNNQLDKLGNIIVNSMHKYQPRLHIVEASCTDLELLRHKEFQTIIFPDTQFMTVTAYQNDKITQLKINNNPFAKGFRHPFARVRPRSRYHINQRYSSTGSESSVEEGITTSLSVIHTGPHFVSGTIRNEQEVVSFPLKILKKPRQSDSDSTGQSKSSPTLPTPHHSQPIVYNVPSTASPVRITSSPPFMLSQQKPLQQQIFNTLPAPPPPHYRKLSVGSHVKKQIIQPDPTSGQNLPVSSILPPSHYVINPMAAPVHTMNGTPKNICSPPAGIMNGHCQAVPMMMINGSKYLLYVPPGGGPPSLVPMPSAPPLPSHTAVYTSAPVQLINTAPTATSQPAFQLPTRSKISPKSTKPAPPPLLSIRSVNSPTVPTSLVKATRSPTTTEHSVSEKPVIYLQSPPTTCQKLFILPVMSNSQPKNGTVLMSRDRKISSSTSKSPKSAEEHQVPSSMPIYRFGDAIHPVQFMSSPHLSPLTRSS